MYLSLIGKSELLFAQANMTISDREQTNSIEGYCETKYFNSKINELIKTPQDLKTAICHAL
jgi:hypothetical protein